jgi:hypothetical protein
VVGDPVSEVSVGDSVGDPLVDSVAGSAFGSPSPPRVTAYVTPRPTSPSTISATIATTSPVRLPLDGRPEPPAGAARVGAAPSGIRSAARRSSRIAPALG